MVGNYYNYKQPKQSEQKSSTVIFENKSLEVLSLIGSS
jgi:hypothetical protein